MKVRKIEHSNGPKKGRNCPENLKGDGKRRDRKRDNLKNRGEWQKVKRKEGNTADLRT
jgi:hypothetical protein